MMRRLAIAGLLAGLIGSATVAPAQDTGRQDVESVLARESTRLDSLLSPESRAGELPDIDDRIRALDAGRFDSLGAVLRDHAGMHLSFDPGRASTYNRAEGTRTSAGADLRLSRLVRFDGFGGYAFGAHRWVGRSGVEFGRRRTGPLLRLEAQDRIQAFGPDRIETGDGLVSLLGGQDRQDYLRRREAGVWFTPIRGNTDDDDEPESWIRAGAWVRDDRSVESVTDDHLAGGGTPMEHPNPAVDDVKLRGVTLEGRWKWRAGLIEAAGSAGLAERAGFEGAGYASQAASLTLRPVVPGGLLALTVEGRNTAGAPPIQEEPFLGGDATVRGYGRSEFTGRRRLRARLEYESGIDLLRRAQVPVLGGWRIQFIPFADVGTTWGSGRGLSGAGTVPLDGEPRASFGLGIRKDLWLPGLRGVRLDISRRTDGSAEDPVSFWFRLLPYRDW
jgi:hypothetical protein